MSATWAIQSPYLIAQLPRPFDAEKGRYLVGDVFSFRSHQQRKKRPELVVGIDGESANLYEVSGSCLIASYPIPPSLTLACAPVSFRFSLPNDEGIVRHTYVAGHNVNRSTATSHKNPYTITLFRDFVDPTGKATSTTTTFHLPNQLQPVALELSQSIVARYTVDKSRRYLAGSLFVVGRRGEIVDLDLESLKSRWQMSTSKLSHETSVQLSAIQVEFAATSTLKDVAQGLFSTSSDGKSQDAQKSLRIAFNANRPHTDPVDPNPNTLILVARAQGVRGPIRQLFIFQTRSPKVDASTVAPLILLHNVPILHSPNPTSPAQFRLYLQSGSLIQSSQDNISVVDLTLSVPKVQSKIDLPEDQTSTTIRISPQSALICSPEKIDVIQLQYNTLQTSTPINIRAIATAATVPSHSATKDGHDETAEEDGDGDVELKDISSAKSTNIVSNYSPQEFYLASYFKRLELAILVCGNAVMAIPIEAPKIHGKRFLEGALIDAVGKGGRATKLDPESTTPKASTSMKDQEEFDKRTAELDHLLQNKNITEFERTLASHLQVALSSESESPESESETNNVLPTPWAWLESESYPLVDRRWIKYAISRVFAVHAAQGLNEASLQLVLEDSNVLVYLVVAGHLSLGTIRYAFRSQSQSGLAVATAIDQLSDAALAHALVQCLVEADPSMDLLTKYISVTNLGPIELLTAILAVMQSLGFIQRDTYHVVAKKPRHPAYSPASSKTNDDEDEGESEIKSLEKQLQVTEHYLKEIDNLDSEDPLSSARINALTVAFSKLGRHASRPVVEALRLVMKTHEILSFIFILRNELVHGAWTSRYLETQPSQTSALDDGQQTPPPDGSICLLADLLSRCLDAIGPVGWLLNEQLAIGDESAAPGLGEFLATLRLETDAALESVQEAAFVSNLLDQIVPYRHDHSPADGDDDASSKKTKAKKQAVVNTREARMLPMEWKSTSASGGVDKYKVVSGGEIVERSRREVGMLLSKQVATYSLERL